MADLLASLDLGAVEKTREKGWINRRDLEERYGEEFVRELDAEASRLLGAGDSSLHEMDDERFSAEDLAEASALLRTLFRHRKKGTSGGRA